MTNLAPVPDTPGDFSRPDPHDLGAEQAALGSMMLSAVAAETCMAALGAEDFYRPGHGLIFAHITAMMRAGEPVDALTVKGRLDAAGDIGRMGGAPYLHTLIASVPVVANAPEYARIVREHAVRRRLLLAGRRIVQWGTGQNADSDAHGLAERALREVEAVRDSGIGDGITVKTITEFLDVPEGADDYDWVIPGLLERGDRLMLTGVEGGGKSTLMRQLGVTIAAGIHPLTHLDIEPRRVLIIDNQDSERQVRRKIRPMVAQARLQRHPVSESNLWIEARGRMDLALDRDASWLLRQVATVRPDVLMIGPLCNLAPRALNSDDDAAPIIAVIDMIRERDVCVILEAHSGHGIGPGGKRDPRPRGSAAFLGWPEFGYGLRWTDDPQGATQRTVDLVSWRGDRDERQWPEMLTAGGVWPWKVYDPVSAGWEH
jgi:DnaB-like helicase N terminal domain/AAA domain